MEFPNKGDAKPPKKEPLKPVVSGASIAKNPATRRLARFIFAESPKTLSAQIGRDIVVPRLKASLEEALNGFISGMFWGGSGRPPINIVRGPQFRNMTPYSSASQMQPQAQQQARQIAAPIQSTGNYQDLVLPTLLDAENLLAGLFEQLNQYNVVPVGELYEMAGITTAVSDNSYGWTNLSGARISKVREGFLLELPRPSLI